MTEPTRLRVLSYNVHSQRGDGIAMAELFRSLRPDVAILQEGPRRFRWRQRAATLARTTGMVFAAGGLPALGNVVLTTLRVRVHQTWQVRFPLTPGRHLRAAVLARCSIGGAPFVLAGSHLSLDPAERVAQATALKEHLVGVDAPVLLGADLNERPGGAAWRAVADGMVDAAVASGCEHTGTFPSSHPTGRIDAIFVDPEVRIDGYQVIETPQARVASDHLPIVVDVTLPPG